MQSLKEQYLERMDSETALLVLKPPLLMIASRLFIALAIIGGIPFAYRLILCDNNITDLFTNSADVVFIFIFMLFMVVVLRICFVLIEELLTKSFKLYSDRAEKHYYCVFNKKIAYLKGADIFILVGRRSFLHITPKGSHHFGERIKYPIDLNGFSIDRNLNNIINSFKSIGIELKKNSNLLSVKYEQVDKNTNE